MWADTVAPASKESKMGVRFFIFVLLLVLVAIAAIPLIYIAAKKIDKILRKHRRNKKGNKK